MGKSKKYYLGLDIGTNSVGYAATGENYLLLKFRGEPVWGVTTFESAALSDGRRASRTSRRRLDRRQQRVKLLQDIFAPEICKIDPDFFIRRTESALFAEDTRCGVRIFDGGIDDREYHRKYPTIHHLIADLMDADAPRDIRLVYLACAWLVANRGHFLSEVNADQVGDFQRPYEEFLRCFTQDFECQTPWADSVSYEIVQRIMQAQDGINQKKAKFKSLVFDGKTPSKNRRKNSHSAGMPSSPCFPAERYPLPICLETKHTKNWILLHSAWMRKTMTASWQNSEMMPISYGKCGQCMIALC